MTSRDDCDFSREQDGGYAERQRLRRRLQDYQETEGGDAFADVEEENE